MSTRTSLPRATKRPRKDGELSDEEDKKESTSRRTSRSGGSSDTKRKSSNTSSSKPKAEEDTRVWVECDKCGKWRALPPHVDSAALPDIWYCELNTYDDKYNHCSKEEEVAPDTAEAEASKERKAAQDDTVGLRGFCGQWVKRLKSADRVVNYHPPGSTVTRGSRDGKRKKTRTRSALDHQTDWIRCNNPMCGKWRAIPKGFDVGALIRRSVKRKWGGLAYPPNPLDPPVHMPTINSHNSGNVAGWCCWMNTWDDTTASCTAPQEDLYSCAWNLNSRKTRNV